MRSETTQNRIKIIKAMKIDRLRKLDQFVDWISELDESGEEYINKEVVKECSLEYPAIMLITDKILAYNDFLKQPLKKEMFVDEIEKPKISAYQNLDGTNDISQFDNDFEEWQEAEKKIMSDEVKLINQVLIWKSFEYKVLGGHFKSWDEIGQHMTLEDLAEKTDGQLKLKNIEL